MERKLYSSGQKKVSVPYRTINVLRAYLKRAAVKKDVVLYREKGTLTRRKSQKSTLRNSSAKCDAFGEKAGPSHFWEEFSRLFSASLPRLLRSIVYSGVAQKAHSFDCFLSRRLRPSSSVYDAFVCTRRLLFHTAPSFSTCFSWRILPTVLTT